MSKKFFLDTSPFAFCISTNSSLVEHNLQTIYSSLLTPYDGQQSDYYVQLNAGKGLRRVFRRQAHFFTDQYEPFSPLSSEQGYALLEWGMNYTIAANEMQHVIVHSAVLAKEDKAVLFPAPPGSGKSTLTCYLANNGWRLLSDEMALVVPNSNTVVPYVRPICLKNQSISLAKNWFNDGAFSSIAPATHKGDVIHLSPPQASWDARHQPAQIAAIVFPQYRPDIALDIYALDKQQSFMQLAENAFNYGVVGSVGFDTITQLVEKSACFEVHYNSLKEVEAFLTEELMA
ncbi:HprK-related kinase A [Neiella sp. HB171785]|uniref:HprK-related kinase A n=1 Tax=Neiella litorisoli TaxID=2771431 RepID=A0A8J6UF47_9GAMM|nr:HprK-related kinase A [Neiella litorisoli]MBD1390524.1 HprK-related kinase A [Neiella litorisoli]